MYWVIKSEYISIKIDNSRLDLHSNHLITPLCKLERELGDIPEIGLANEDNQSSQNQYDYDYWDEEIEGFFTKF